MPTVRLNKRVFENLVGKKLPKDELKDRISMLGTDLERIEKNEIVVEVFPNRPDMLSEQGFARAFSSFIGVKTGLKKYNAAASKYKLIVDKSVAKVRPYTACAVVKGMKFDDEKIKEIIQMQEKLHVTYGRHRKKAAIGIYPMEKIKFPITFEARRPEDISFQPLESNKVLNGRQILSQHPTGRDYGHLLQDMQMYPVFVDANNEILSMPPIVNSHRTGKINEKTKEVFIECSGFDFQTLSKCLNMIVTAMADMGGKIYSMQLAYPDKTRKTPELGSKKMKLDRDYINKRLGLDLNDKEIKNYLERMGFGYEKGTVQIPAYRVDIMHMVDFVEDIAISYGYENFEAQIPDCATIGKENPYEIFKAKIAQLLVGLGMFELNTYNITNKTDQTEKMNTDIGLIMLKNALSTDYNALRAWVIPSLMETLSANKHNEYPQNLFTIGRIFKKGDTETGVIENDRLSVAICSENADYTKIRQVFDYICTNLDIKCDIEEAEHDSFIPGRVARASFKKKGVAYIGEISPEVLEKWELKYPVAVFELNLTDLYNLIK